jgi:hypothetical protein
MHFYGKYYVLIDLDLYYLGSMEEDICEMGINISNDKKTARM